MSLNIRSTEDCERFDLFEGDERIGEIARDELSEVELAELDEGEEPLWLATIWSATGTGATWSVETETYEEAAACVPELYEDFLAERRELSKGARSGKTISVPMGGQPRRR